MKIIVRAGSRTTGTWPEGWPVPRIGEEIDYKGVIFTVRTVVWYPEGDINSFSPEPYVYVVARS